MDLRHLIILLLSSSLCSSEVTIFPNLSEILLKEGDELELTCTSTDGDEIDFFYPHNFENWIETSTTEIVRDPTSDPCRFTLRKPITNVGDTGWYGCIEARKNIRKLNYEKLSVTPNTYDEIFIKWVYVYVTSSSTHWVFTNQKITTLSTVGSNAILPCRPNSPEIIATLSFEDLFEAVPLDDRLSFDSKVGFTLLNVTENDAKTYICKIGNFTDDIIFMTLGVEDNCLLPILPQIDNYSPQQMTLGQDFSMNCSIEYVGVFSPNLFRWITPRGNKQITKTLVTPSEDIMLYFSELTIKNVTVDDVGEYTCQFYEEVVRTVKINLQLHNETYFKLSSNKFLNYRAPVDRDIEFVVKFEAYPVPKFQWFDPKGNEVGDDWSLRYEFVVNSEQFSVRLFKYALTYEDYGTYTLKATHPAGSEEVKVTLDFPVGPTVVQKSEDTEIISASYNQTVSAECVAQGNLLPIITWKYSHNFENSAEHTAEGDLFNITLNFVDGNKIISTIDVKAQNTGELICKACDEIDCSSSVVKVINVPVLMKLPPDQPASSDYQVVSLSEGETLRIFCASTEDSTFFYPTLGNNLVNSNLTLELQEAGRKGVWLERKQVVYGDSGWYACANMPVEYHNLTEYWFNFNPDNYKDPNVQWVYVFVQSSNYLFVENIYLKKDSDNNYILEVNVGNDLLIPCRPTSPDYQVDLYLDGQKANLSDHLLYDPKKGFTVLNVTWEMPFSVYCTIKDTTAEHLQKRDFNVYLKRPTNGTDSPKIFTETLTQMVVGKPFTLQCKAYFNRVQTNYKFKWNTPKPGNRITHLYQLSGTEKTIIENSQPQTGFVVYELTIENVTTEHFGKYGCFIYEYSTVKSDTIYLAPHERNQLELSSSANQITVEIGKDWFFYVNGSAFPLPNFKWYDPTGREREIQWTFRNYKVNGESFEVVLEIKNASFEDSGTHKLVANNSEITKTITFDVLVKVKPQITTPKYVYVGNYMLNQKVEFQCQASGYPMPKLNWSYGNNYSNFTRSSGESELFENETTTVTGKTTVTSTVTIKMVDSGPIRCNACNEQGCTQYQVQVVNVFDPDVACPKLETPVASCENVNVHTNQSLESNQISKYDLIMASQQVDAAKGASVSIRCMFSDDKFLNDIFWLKTNDSLATNDRLAINSKNDAKTHLYVSELTITDVDKSDEGYYICQGTTKDGSSIKNEYKLHINASPALAASIITQLSIILL